MSKKSLSEEEGLIEKNVADITLTSTRYYVLLLCCIILFNIYFSYESPSALQTEIEDVIST